MKESNNWRLEYDDSFFRARKTKVYGNLGVVYEPLPMPQRGTSPKRGPKDFRCRFCGMPDLGKRGDSDYDFFECVEMSLCYQCADQRAFCYECGDEMPTPCPGIKQEDIICIECSNVKPDST